MSRRAPPSIETHARWSFALAGLLFACGACSRTPPEPQPIATGGARETAEPHASASAMTSATAASAPRCIKPLAEAPPPKYTVAKPPACPPDKEGQGRLPTAQVAFPDAPSAPKADVELAKTPHDIERGLMYRMTMPEDHGMLFTLDERREHTFWMHNTCLPLDMLFVDTDGTIVGIVESAEPLTDTTRSVGCASSFVLEMNAGWSRRHGVKPGQRLGIPASAK